MPLAMREHTHTELPIEDECPTTMGTHALGAGTVLTSWSASSWTQLTQTASGEGPSVTWQEGGAAGGYTRPLKGSEEEANPLEKLLTDVRVANGLLLVSAFCRRHQAIRSRKVRVKHRQHLPGRANRAHSGEAHNVGEDHTHCDENEPGTVTSSPAVEKSAEKWRQS